MTIFYDSARYGLIPAGADACLYSDGRYAASPADARRFARVRWITIAGGAGAAERAGCADFETYNPVHDVPGRLREWAEARRAMNTRARVYTNRSDLPAAHALVGDLPNVSYWVATLDGHPWTAAEMIADLARLGVVLEEGKLWAIQYAGGMTAPFDISILLGAW